MKKLFLIAAIMVATVSANAQTFIKPMVGGTMSTISGDWSDTEAKIGLVAGFEGGYNLNEKIGITAGVLYSMQGTDIKNIDNGLALEYVNVPVLFNYYVTPSFALKAGPQLGFLTKAELKKTDIKDRCNSMDISLPIGASYEFSDFVIDVRYNIGLNSINKSGGKGFHTEDVKNSVFMVTLGYKIAM
jgi:hypothetical protein